MQTLILVIFFSTSIKMGCTPTEKNTQTAPELLAEVTEVVEAADESKVDLSVNQESGNVQEEIKEKTKEQSVLAQKKDIISTIKEQEVQVETEAEKLPSIEGTTVDAAQKESSIDASANEKIVETVSSSPNEDMVNNAELGNTAQSVDNKGPEVSLKTPQEEKMEAPVVSIHDLWNVLLQAHVNNTGFVDYTGLKMAESKLDKYLQALSAEAPKKSDKSIKAKVFWINAYNAFTIKLILKNMPVQSIRDISKGEPWSVKWIELGSEVYSLNNIEHDILRPTWGDARIHFAVNCAAKSCPPISNEAFTESNQDQKLESLSKSFINNSKFNSVSPSKLVLSKIFEWYKTDFGDLASFIDKYATVDIGSSPTITYQDYDWSLNGK